MFNPAGVRMLDRASVRAAAPQTGRVSANDWQATTEKDEHDVYAVAPG